MTIIPTEFNVLVKPDPVEETVRGIYLPDQTKEADKFSQQKGTLVAVSPHAFSYAGWEDDDPALPRVGDRVFFAKFEGVNIRDDDLTEYRLLKDKAIAAVIR